MGLLPQLREDYLLERLGFCGDGDNGEWRSSRWARIQDPESPGTGWVKLAMELSNAAWLTAMELGKIQYNLSSRERSIIKLLPPCLAWLKCHAFSKGLNFIFLSLVIFNSTQNMIPSLQPSQSGTPGIDQLSIRVQKMSGIFFLINFQYLVSGFKRNIST